MSHIQSVIFDKKIWNTENSLEWLKSYHIIPLKKVHVTKNFLRFRIREPKYKHYVTKKLNNGIEIILGI